MANSNELEPKKPVYQDFGKLLQAHAQSRPNDRAVVCGSETLSWGTLLTRVNRTAQALTALGIGKNDKVAILSKKTTLANLEVLLGTLRAGACVVPLSGMASPETLALMINDSDAHAIFLSEDAYETLAPVEANLERLLPGGKFGLDFHTPDWQDFTAWRDSYPDQEPTVFAGPQDGFNLIYSSGTTGVPKGILHNRALRFNQLDALSKIGYGPHAVSLVSTPLYSNTTLVPLLGVLGHGGLNVLMPRFDEISFLELSQQQKITHAMLVPVQYERLLANPAFDQYDLSSYQLKLCTSAPLRAETKRRILDRWPGVLLEFYALTEGGGVVALNATQHPDKLATVGQPFPGSDIRIIGENGEELPRGSIGEVVGRSDVMMDGYYKREQATKDIYWQNSEGNLFLRSGDLGRFDPDGFLQLLDRKKDMIISGGFNIYAVDLETVLLSHEAVVDAAVIGIPSQRWGETPLGMVVLAEGTEQDPAELCQWANEKLGKAQRLAEVVVRDNLPRNPIGKILKRELRAPYWQESS